MIKNPAVRLGGALIPLGGMYAYRTYHDLNRADPTRFADFGRDVTYLGAAILLWGIVLVASETGKNAPTPASPGTADRLRLWSLGYGWVLLLALLLAIEINPHAIFDTSSFLYLGAAARNVKMDLYQNLDYAPQLVIMGSSRAFSLPPAYIEQQTGYKTFNYSVEVGRGVDFVLESRLITRTKRAALPHLFLVEIGLERPGDEFGVLNLQPVKMLPYMSPDIGAQVARRWAQDIFSIRSISDSFYLLANKQLRLEDAVWTFKADGLALRKPITPKEYQGALPGQILLVKPAFECASLDPLWQQNLAELVRTAEGQHISILFYQSPVNPSLYNAALRGSEKYHRCNDLLVNFMAGLVAKHPNVYFRDLATFEPVLRLGQDGFYDIVHLRPNAAYAVVDALVPEMKEAYQRSVARRAQP